MGHIFQGDEIICGIACVATITGKSVNEVKKTIFPDNYQTKSVFKTTYPQLIGALKKFGWSTDNTYRPTKDFFSQLPEHKALLRSHYKGEETTATHWLFYNPDFKGKNKIYDPENEERISVETAKKIYAIKSFLQIYGKSE